MQITEKFRDRILIAMPELSQADAKQIAELEHCTTMTVYNHWKRLKNLEGEISTIMISIGELAASRKPTLEKKEKSKEKRVAKIMRQLSAA